MSIVWYLICSWYLGAHCPRGLRLGCAGTWCLHVVFKGLLFGSAAVVDGKVWAVSTTRPFRS